jgi:hypothetical protein
MQPQEERAYVLQYKQGWADVDYSATWFSTPQSTVRISIKLYRRRSPELPWEPIGSDETELNAQSAQDTQADSIGVGLPGEETGLYYVRAEVAVVAYPGSGQIVTETATNEFDVMVLKDPGEIKADFDAVRPAVGELSADNLFLDWRVWKGGPCAITEKAQSDPSGDNVARACEALNNGDLETTLSTYWQAAQQARDPELGSCLWEQFGLLLATAKNWDGAANAFQAAVTTNEARADAWHVAMNLHNYATASFMRGADEQGWHAYSRFWELRSGFWDEFGSRLAEANIHFHAKQSDNLANVRWYFENNGLKDHADIMNLWLEKLRAESQQ